MLLQPDDSKAVLEQALLAHRSPRAMAGLLALKAKEKKAEQAISRHFKDDHKIFIEKNIRLRTANQGIQPFIFNSGQNLYWPHRTNYDIILKPRKEGFSMLKLADGLCYAIMNEGWHSKIVAHTPDAYKELKEAQMIMFDSIPDRFKPKVSKDNEGVLYFQDLNSKITVANAGATEPVAENVGRGETINFLHLSEYSRYAYPEKTFNSLFNCVPQGGLVSIESTPYGHNDFYFKVQDARAGLSAFKLHFIRWFDSNLNRIEGDAPLVYDEQEELLVKKYNVDDAHLRWRRWKLSGLGTGLKAERMFNQEYPSDVDLCFLRGEGGFFDADALLWHKNECRAPVEIKHDTHVRIFKHVEPNKKYVAGADTSEGTGTGDYSSCRIIEFESGEEVCHIHGRFHPKLFAKYIAAMGFYYNTAFLGVEKNNHGHSVILALVEIEKYPQEKLYCHKPNKFGWLTTAATRPVLLDDYEEAFNKKYFISRCEIAVGEHFSFVVGSDGKAAATRGGHDDTVISGAIAWQMRKVPQGQYQKLW